MRMPSNRWLQVRGMTQPLKSHHIVSTTGISTVNPIFGTWFRHGVDGWLRLSAECLSEALHGSVERFHFRAWVGAGQLECYS
jgi:hypothetical protein